ncbi:phosphoethanolamine N-methyltransferase 1-like [Hibiscus syriacus]|uniref:Phosphoethanolamine N-methyltransferase 1-like n=2 Tax=Hibiscus syriacus TaxID=106335 RepID=A0A6A3B1Y4_HIBSY|nr:phosphoethanolamine N-methyltransferase 1-like [Hibiscus syriacus]
MGNSEFEVRSYIEALKLHNSSLEEVPDGTVLSRLPPTTTNCLAEESAIYLHEGKVVQDLLLRLRDVECGEVEIQLEWIHFPGSKTFLSQ